MNSKTILIVYLINTVFGVPFRNQLENNIDFENVDKNIQNGRVLSVREFQNYGFNLSEIQPRLIADAFLTVPQLLRKYDYPCEIHKVHTKDGYILEMHRIPKPGAVPIYLQHGIIDSSAGWVIMGPQTAFAYQLSDLGYDVWMGNTRGNRYSRDHVYLNPDHKDYWDFSFHEIGLYDLPAMIDYVIEKTNFTKIHYVAHSQGTTSFWVMCEYLEGYCDKIASMHALAPIAYMQNVRSPFIRALAPIIDQLEIVSKLIGMYEFLPNNDIMTMAGQYFCKQEAITQSICSNIAFLIAGYNSEQLNKTMLPAIIGHIPAGASSKQLIHYGQLVKSGKFRQYDYGYIKNIFKYRSFRPPSYDLSKVTAPVALHYSLNDWLAHPKDVLKLEYELPNIIKNYEVPLPKFNHMDFLMAINSRQLVYDEVVRIIRQVESKTHKIYQE